jgi:CheY-like chemotaxis protein
MIIFWGVATAVGLGLQAHPVAALGTYAVRLDQSQPQPQRSVGQGIKDTEAAIAYIDQIHEQNQKTLSDKLQKFGDEVVRAADEAQALQALATGDPSSLPYLIDISVNEASHITENVKDALQAFERADIQEPLDVRGSWWEAIGKSAEATTEILHNGEMLEDARKAAIAAGEDPAIPYALILAAGARLEELTVQLAEIRAIQHQERKNAKTRATLQRSLGKLKDEEFQRILQILLSAERNKDHEAYLQWLEAHGLSQTEVESRALRDAAENGPVVAVQVAEGLTIIDPDDNRNRIDAIRVPDDNPELIAQINAEKARWDELGMMIVTPPDQGVPPEAAPPAILDDPAANGRQICQMGEDLDRRAITFDEYKARMFAFGATGNDAITVYTASNGATVELYPSGKLRPTTTRQLTVSNYVEVNCRTSAASLVCLYDSWPSTSRELLPYPETKTCPQTVPRVIGKLIP